MSQVNLTTLEEKNKYLLNLVDNIIFEGQELVKDNFKSKLFAFMKDLNEVKDELLKECIKQDENKHKYIPGVISLAGNFVDSSLLVNEWSDEDAQKIMDRNCIFLGKKEALEYDKKEQIFRKIIRCRDSARNGWTPLLNNNDKKCFILPKRFEINIVDLKAWEYDITSHSFLLAFKDIDQVKDFRKLVSDKEILDFFNI